MKNWLSIPFALFGLICCVCLCSCTETSVEIEAGKKSQIKNDKPVVKVFLENSGSMDGFMCDGSELKDDIYNYLTDVKDFSSRMDLYYINSKVINRNVTLQQYVKNLNPAAFKAAGGNRAYTEIPDLFEKVLAEVNKNTIAVYISDCILDIPTHHAPDFLNITKTDMHSIFGDKIAKIKDLAVCVYQLESTFKGTYFFPTGSSKPYNGKLPYYMIIIGPNSKIAYLKKNVPESSFTHGVKHFCAFSSKFTAPAILEQGARNSTKITIKSKARNGQYKFKVLADLSNSLLSDEVLTNPSNFSMTSSSIHIESIIPITDKNSDYSHVMNFSIDDAAFGSVVSLKKVSLPKWVSEANDKGGKNVYSNKTFGIEYLIKGISEAFRDDKLTSFKLNIKKQ